MQIFKQILEAQKETFETQKKLVVKSVEYEKKLKLLKEKNHEILTENENRLKKMRKDNEVLVDALRLEFGKKNKTNQEKIAKYQVWVYIFFTKY